MKTLRPFEAAARHLSFTAAADELFVTQAAVSKQIRVLEEWLGTRLFLRKGRTVELTGAGSALHDAVSMGLGYIAETATRIGQRRAAGRFSIAMRLAFASQFMATRIARFRVEFPDIDINIVTTEGNPLSLLDSVDLAVAPGAESQPDLYRDYLFSEEVFPICAPSYLEAHREFCCLQDLPQQKLLHLGHAHWRELSWEPIDWPALARALGLARSVGYEGLSFDSYELLTNAAVSGVGVAVGWQHLCADHLERGLLVRPVPEALTIDRAHYLVGHRTRVADPIVQRLREWIVEETAAFRVAA